MKQIHKHEMYPNLLDLTEVLDPIIYNKTWFELRLKVEEQINQIYDSIWNEELSKFEVD